MYANSTALVSSVPMMRTVPDMCSSSVGSIGSTVPIMGPARPNLAGPDAP